MAMTMKLSEIICEQEQEKKNILLRETEEEKKRLALEEEASERFEELLFEDYLKQMNNEYGDNLLLSSSFLSDTPDVLDVPKREIIFLSEKEKDILNLYHDFEENFVESKLDYNTREIQYYDPDIGEEPLDDRYCPPLNREFIGINTSSLSRGELACIIGKHRCVFKAICRDTMADYIYHIKYMNEFGEDISLIAIWGLQDTLENAYVKVLERILSVVESNVDYEYVQEEQEEQKQEQQEEQQEEVQEVQEVQEEEQCTFNPDIGEIPEPNVFCPPINRQYTSISTSDIPKNKIGLLIGKNGSVLKGITEHSHADYIYWIESEQVIRIWGVPETLRNAKMRVNRKIEWVNEIVPHYTT